MKWTLIMTLTASLIATTAARLSAQPVLQPVTDALRPFVDKQEIAGCVAMVIEDGKVVHFDAIGLADIASNRPMQKDELFWVASQTKPMTAVCLLMLLEE